MNTICKRCLFVNPSPSEKCFFNIPTLLKKSDYSIRDTDGYNVIENYDCSYAFSKEHYEKHKEELPENMIELIQEKNRLDYYLIISFDDEDNNTIISECDKISTLHTMPTKISVLCKTDKIKPLIQYFKTHKIYKDIDWKLHNLTEDYTDVDKLKDILNVNLIKTVNNIWYVHSRSLEAITEDLNYINFLSKVMKPEYPAIRKNDENLDGLFISSNNLKLIKNEHDQEYVDFLQENCTLVRKYYE